MRIMLSLLSLMAMLLLGACNSGPDPVTLNTVKTGTPALWKVTGTQPGQVGTAYMFGTIHILPDDVQWRTPALEAAIAGSDQLVIEVLGLDDPQSASRIFARLAVSPGQEKLDARIKPSLRDDLNRIIDASNLPERSLNRMETWAAALSLASAQTKGLGLDSSGGVGPVCKGGQDDRSAGNHRESVGLFRQASGRAAAPDADQRGRRIERLPTGL